MKTIDDVIQKLEYIMESDPRTFSNPECEYGWMFHKINEAIKMLKEIEKELPSAQPECKMGKWILDKRWSEGAGMGESYGHYWRCNQCNNIVKGDWAKCGDNFCSECGADMRGEQDE